MINDYVGLEVYLTTYFILDIICFDTACMSSANAMNSKYVGTFAPTSNALIKLVWN